MKTTVDLVPPELRVRETVQQRATGWIGVVVAVIIALVLMTVALRVQIRRNEAAIVPLRTRVLELQAQEPRALRINEDIRLLTTRLNDMQGLVDEPDWNALLHDVAVAATGDLWVAECSFERTFAPGLEFAGDLVIMGSAASEADVASFVSALGFSSRLQDLRVQVNRPLAAELNAVEFSVAGRFLMETQP